MVPEIPPSEENPMERANELLPWLKHLPQNERREVFSDLIGSVSTSLGLGCTESEIVRRLVVELDSWKATAEVHADPELYRALTSPVRPEDLVEAPRPVGTPRVKPKRRCGASLPNGDGDWHYCEHPMLHPGPHEDAEKLWQDTDVVDVTTVDEVRAVSHHVHDFVGDKDTCVQNHACQLTWGEFTAQKREWESTWKGASADYVIVDEIQGFIPPQREGNDG